MYVYTFRAVICFHSEQECGPQYPHPLTDLALKLAKSKQLCSLASQLPQRPSQDLHTIPKLLVR